MTRIKRTVFLCLALLLLFLIVWTIWGNTALTVTEYTVTSGKLPLTFSGFRIAQVSDLHNAQFGTDNQALLSALRQTDPDIILFTGDLVDSRSTDIDAAVLFAAQAASIAPCYYAPGNHEARLSEYSKIIKQLEKHGVTVLENRLSLIERDGDYISLLGICDPSFYEDYLFGDAAAVTQALLLDIPRDHSLFTVLLAHRPECFAEYVSGGIDLVFSGHAHGGQFRLPFVGGLFAPNQGFFPKYDAGLFAEENTTMIVSRGIGNSIFPFRFNNRPEIVVAELLCE